MKGKTQGCPFFARSSGSNSRVRQFAGLNTSCEKNHGLSVSTIYWSINILTDNLKGAQTWEFRAPVFYTKCCDTIRIGDLGTESKKGFLSLLSWFRWILVFYYRLNVWSNIFVSKPQYRPKLRVVGDYFYAHIYAYNVFVYEHLK
jgi:hypothetical protein